MYFLRRAGIRRLASNRAFLAACLATLVWLADQPTVAGYNPLLEMFWDPGFLKLPVRDGMVLLCSWLLTAIFCHLVFFVVGRARRRELGH